MAIEVPICGGGVVLVDEQDAHLVSAHSWRPLRPATITYAVATVGGRTAYLHRMIAEPNAGQVVDHINGDGLDNRRANLRVCKRGENLRNRKKSSHSRQPFKGIQANGKKWRVRIQAFGKKYELCGFKTPEEAAQAYDLVAVLQFGEFACVNFPHVFPELSTRGCG